MSHSEFIISTGDLSAMYTLKQLVTVKKYDHLGMYESTYYEYVQNLSTDKQKALEKARLITGVNDISFRAPDDLNEYREGVAATKLAEKEALEVEREKIRIEKIEEMKNLIDQGLFPYETGNYKTEIIKLSADRINFFATCDVDQDTIGEYLQNWILKHIENAILPNPTKQSYVAEPKTRFEFSGIVTKRASFESYDFRGRPIIKFVHTIVTEEGFCLVTFQDTFYEDVGETVKGKCTIKSNDVREDVFQSVVQRIKLA